jgi:hypothetical protein
MGSLLNKNSTTGIQASMTKYPNPFIPNPQKMQAADSWCGAIATAKTIRCFSIFSHIQLNVQCQPSAEDCCARAWIAGL